MTRPAFPVRPTPGKPALPDTASRVDCGGSETEVVLRRDAGAFIVEALAPLFLLEPAVFATLLFPPTLAKERMTIPVTGIPTSAVLLIPVSNQLPALGCTVALEYVFHAFFGLCPMSTVMGLLRGTRRNRKLPGHAFRTGLFGRVACVATVAATVG